LVSEPPVTSLATENVVHGEGVGLVDFGPRREAGQAEKVMEI